MLKEMILKLFVCLLLCSNLAAAPAEYCALLKQIHPGMQIREVFMILGPPHTFGQPPNLDLAAMYNKSTMVAPPQGTISNAATERQLMQNIIDSDPILSAFANAPPNSENALIWQYENNTLSIAVKTKGSKVVEINANFSC